MIFDSKSPDLSGLMSFYVNDDIAEEDEEDKKVSLKQRRTFLIAEHRGRVVATAAIREMPGNLAMQL